MTRNKKNQGKNRVDSWEDTLSDMQKSVIKRRYGEAQISRHYASDNQAQNHKHTHTTIIIYSYLKSFSDPPPCLVFLTSPLVHPGDYSPKSQTGLILDSCLRWYDDNVAQNSHKCDRFTPGLLFCEKNKPVYSMHIFKRKTKLWWFALTLISTQHSWHSLSYHHLTYATLLRLWTIRTVPTTDPDLKKPHLAFDPFRKKNPQLPLVLLTNPQTKAVKIRLLRRNTI